MRIALALVSEAIEARGAQFFKVIAQLMLELKLARR